MKRNFITFIFACLSFLFIATAAQAADTYTLDPQHTYVLWQIKHFGFSTQAGKWYASGTLILDKENPANNKVNATIQVANMITGIPELDKHLKGKLFFDVEKFKVATFVSNKVTMVGQDAAKVVGTLTLHGISKPVTLDVKLNQAGINPITDKATVGFSAKAQINRSDFGITALLPGLGNDVQLTIQAEAFKQ